MYCQSGKFEVKN